MPRRTGSNLKLEMPFEIECGKETVVYKMVFEVTPHVPGRHSGPPELCYPSEGGDVESKAAYYVYEKKCDEPSSLQFGPANHPFRCKCRGSGVVKARERRPELDGVIPDKELIEYAISRLDNGED